MSPRAKIELAKWGIAFLAWVSFWVWLTSFVSATPSAQHYLRAMVNASAARNGVPAALLHGIIKTESGYRCTARNPASNVHGIGQLKPETARSVGITGNLYDCQNGIEAAARYLAIAIRKGGAGCAGVSLYELGVGAAPRCTAYGRRVLENARTS